MEMKVDKGMNVNGGIDVYQDFPYFVPIYSAISIADGCV